MGGWKLEAFKMGIYMVFPVGCFWLFNQPRFYESWVMEKRDQLYVLEDPKAKEEIRKAIELLEQKRQLKLEAEMDDFHQ